MTKYLLSRLLRGLFSIIIVVAIVMVMIYSLLDRKSIFQTDSAWSHQKLNAKTAYEYSKWEEYGYLDYIPYSEFLTTSLKNGEITQDEYNAAIKFGDTAAKDSDAAKAQIERMRAKYEKEGYTFIRLDALKSGKTYKDGGRPQIFVYRDIPLINRLVSYFTGLFSVDYTSYVKEDIDNRGIEFTLFDPAYGGAFAPAIMGTGTQHKYLLYFDDQFPFIHQNLLQVNLGKSYSISAGVDVFDILNLSQGSFKKSQVTYPSGNVENSADDIHTLTYVAGSLENGTLVVKTNYVDDYTSVSTRSSGMSKLGYSFVIGLISVALAYLLAIPLGTLMARKKDKLIDKLGTIYIVFIIAVPSLAYIFLFKAIGYNMGLPTTFDMENPSVVMFILPIVSLALPSVANLMKWLRRYMIDQMNSDYVKFARSGGLSEGEIFRKHVLKNAIIPIVHGIPGSVLGSLVGAIITERVYVVPGAGNMLTKAINQYDNGVIVGMTLFYAVISVISVILGDLLMSLMDPRISFTSKRR